MKQFIKCLLASADYDSFYRVMAREGKTWAAKKKTVSTVAEAKREAKGIEENGDLDYKGVGSPAKAVPSDAKGGDNDFDDSYQRK